MPWPKGPLPILLRYIRGNREGMEHTYTYTIRQPFFERFR
jgi:hypothetical protein